LKDYGQMIAQPSTADLQAEKNWIRRLDARRELALASSRATAQVVMRVHEAFPLMCSIL